jgi:hypothetical protein
MLKLCSEDLEIYSCLQTATVKHWTQSPERLCGSVKSVEEGLSR